MKPRVFLLFSVPIALVIWFGLSVLSFHPASADHPPARQAAVAASQYLLPVGQIGGASFAVAVQGPYAYLGIGPRVVILDVSQPATPTLVAQTAPMPGLVQGLVISGSHLYVADDAGGLRVLDVSNPASPLAVSSFASPHPPSPSVHFFGVAVSDTWAYVAEEGRLRVLGLSDGLILGEASHIEQGGLTSPVVSGSHVYLSDYLGNLQVIDVSDPWNPLLASYLDLHWSPLLGAATPAAPEPAGVRAAVNLAVMAPAVAGCYLYAVDSQAHLHVVDVADPANPVVVGSLGTGGYPAGVAISGTYAYIADGDLGLLIVDVGDPTSPRTIASADTPGVAWRVVVSGSRAYVADDYAGLIIFDISDPLNPTRIGSYATIGYVQGITVSGATAYALGASSLENPWDSYRSLSVLDISTPASPTVLGTYGTRADAWQVAFSRPFVYLADSLGLDILDASDPAHLREVGIYDADSRAVEVVVAGRYAYLATSLGLRILEVSDPGHPVPLGLYGFTSTVTDLAVSGGYAYLAEDPSAFGGPYTGVGLRIVNVSDPTKPAAEGFYTITGSAYGVAVGGGYAYLATDRGLAAVDVSNPSRPQEAGFFTSTSGLRDVALVGRRAFVIGGGYGFRLSVVDVTDPRRPAELGSYDGPGYATAVFADWWSVYAADSSGGLYVFHFSDPVQVALGMLAVTGPVTGSVGTTYSFTAGVEPVSSTLPITYTWQTAGQSPTVHLAAENDTAEFVWGTTGPKTVTVTAANESGSVSANHTITITGGYAVRVHLPVIFRSAGAGW